MTLTMIAVPDDVASDMKALVEAGEFESEGEVARAALEEWRARRAATNVALDALRVDIARGMADVASSRTKPFDPARITASGRQVSKRPSRSD